MLVWCIDIWKRKKQLRDKEWQGEKSLAKVPESVLRGLGYIHYIHAKKGTMLNRRRERFKKKKKAQRQKSKFMQKKKILSYQFAIKLILPLESVSSVWL